MRFVLALSLLVLTTSYTSTTAGQRQLKPSVMVCNFEKIAMVQQDPDTGKLSAKTDDSKGTPVLAGLDTMQPTLKGNFGEAKLVTLRDTEEAIWMAEMTETGGVNIWTYFWKEKVVIQSKQYSLGGPFAFVEIGHCK